MYFFGIAWDGEDLGGGEEEYFNIVMARWDGGRVEKRLKSFTREIPLLSSAKNTRSLYTVSLWGAPYFCNFCV